MEKIDEITSNRPDAAPPASAAAVTAPADDLTRLRADLPVQGAGPGPGRTASSPTCSEVVVGFAQQQLQAPYFAAMQVQAEEIADEQGFKLLFQAANKDPVIQMNQMQAMIAQGADVLVVNATSVKGQKEMMTQIASQIPVIYIDTSVPGTGMTSVQSDNLTIGRESGKITAKRFLDMGKQSIKMVILTGPATDEFVGPNRRQGFLDGLKEGGLPYEIKAEQSGDYQQDKGQVAAENMLAGNPDVDLILGLNDSMALGAYNVVNGKDQYKNVYVAASADGQKEALALIKAGRLRRPLHLHRAQLAVAGRRGRAEDRGRGGHRQDQDRRTTRRSPSPRPSASAARTSTSTTTPTVSSDHAADVR